MATVGYYLRSHAVRANDGTLVCGDQWALIRVDNQYQDEVLADGLSERDAVALYWQELAEFQRRLTATGELPLAGDIAPSRRARQLKLKL